MLHGSDAHPLRWHQLVGGLALLACGAALLLIVALGSARSLYAPGVGESLGFDAGVGLLVGFAAGALAYAIHHRARTDEPETPSLPWVAVPAVVAGILLSGLLASRAEDLAREPAGFGIGLDEVLMVILALIWTILVGIFIAFPGPRRRRLFVMGAGTAGALGIGSVLFSAWLLANLERLQALARSRRVSAAAWGIVAAILIATALKRRRNANG